MAGTAALVLACTLAACGGNAGGGETGAASDSTPAAEEAVVSHDPEVEPALVNPGWLKGDNTSDIWWPNGEEGSGEGVYFTNAANDAGMDVTFVDAAGEDLDSVWYLEVADGHLVTLADAPEDKREVDFTFQGNFTCYEAVSDTVYIRGDRSQEEYDALLAGKVFVEDPDNPSDFMVRFEEGGVAIQEQEGYDPLEGTWQVVTTNVVVCHFKTESSEWDTEYRFELGADDSIAELDSGGLSPLQYYEG